jgi:hypothetical protein
LLKLRTQGTEQTDLAAINILDGNLRNFVIFDFIRPRDLPLIKQIKRERQHGGDQPYQGPGSLIFGQLGHRGVGSVDEGWDLDDEVITSTKEGERERGREVMKGSEWLRPYHGQKGTN